MEILILFVLCWLILGGISAHAPARTFVFMDRTTGQRYKPSAHALAMITIMIMVVTPVYYLAAMLRNR